MVSSLLGSLGNSGVDIQGLLSQLGISPAVAENPGQATPDEVAAITAHAHENHPGIFAQAMALYEEHPTLIKTLGAVAVAAIARPVYENGQS